jgi:hypothetical protein
MAALLHKLTGARARGRSSGWNLTGDEGNPRGRPEDPHRGLRREVGRRRRASGGDEAVTVSSSMDNALGARRSEVEGQGECSGMWVRRGYLLWGRRGGGGERK